MKYKNKSLVNWLQNNIGKKFEFGAAFPCGRTFKKQAHRFERGRRIRDRRRHGRHDNWLRAGRDALFLAMPVPMPLTYNDKIKRIMGLP